MLFVEYGKFSSCYIFEFVFSPTLFLISSRTGNVNLSYFVITSHGSVLYFSSLFFLCYHIG